MFLKRPARSTSSRARALVRRMLVTLTAIVGLASPSIEIVAQEATIVARVPKNGSTDLEARIVFRRHGNGQQVEVARIGNANRDVLLKRMRAESDMEFVAIDRRRHRHAVPNDSLFADQWYLQNAQPSAIGANVAWDTTTGSSGIVVAVLDSGVRFDHPDLARAAQAGKLLPGYDFISADSGSGTQFLTANDGNGRDADPTDPGDWIDSNDQKQSIFATCDIENSSWHGTRVSGLIAAASNNSIGIAGTAWQTWILPVRVLGKCGGYDSDILPAMRWAAGLHVTGVPDNPYPAQIINLSFGSDGACSAPYLSVIQELAQHGVVVFASAGNGGGPVDEPANCPGVVAVAGLRQAGTKVGYSSLGPEIVIAAPAGNCVNTTGACLFSLATTFDIGRTVPAGPGYTDQFTTNLGTSFSAPLAAGVGALMRAVNARLAPEHLIARLRESAQSFPDGGATPPPTCHVPVDATDLQQTECVCTTSTCGAGMLYAPAAVAAARRPIASIIAPATVAPGALLNIDGSSSSASCNRSLVTYHWEIVSSQNASLPIPSNADQPIVQISAPTAGSYTLRLTVTDDQGATDSGDIVMTDSDGTATTTPPLAVSACPTAITVVQEPPTPTQPTAMPQSSHGGGGGGNLGVVSLLVLLAMTLIHRAMRFSPAI
jgi:serine protease